jgi:inhibitor of KinA
MTPIFRPVADHALLVEFGSEITAEAYAKVRHLDAILAKQAPQGFIESVPAYVNILVEFDPLLTDHDTLKQSLIDLLSLKIDAPPISTEHKVQICYDPAFAPDLPEVARLCGLSEAEVIAAHLAGEYSVFLYGFAPGYAYLAGVPQSLHLPRKDVALRDVPAGSVIIAAGQCLVTTLKMPTGWWIIGRSTTEILCQNPDRPFLFDVGDSIRFQRITATEFAAQQAAK